MILTAFNAIILSPLHFNIYHYLAMCYFFISCYSARHNYFFGIIDSYNHLVDFMSTLGIKRKSYAISLQHGSHVPIM